VITYQSTNYTLGFDGMVSHIKRDFTAALPVDTGHWQALKGVPQTKTFELQNVALEVPIAAIPNDWARETEPNMPWAEAQFQERVGGKPVNPGETYKAWPYYRGNVEKHQDKEQQFSHTYMERFWPKFANTGQTRPNGRQVFVPHNGIRYEYGDLGDVLDLLIQEPHTRQAYLPIFFPEDTGAHHRERIPCTLGYHFMLRQDKLSCFYPIRSCDFYRHFRDDVYMAGRLVQWIISQLVDRVGLEDQPAYAEETDNVWNAVTPGNLTMFIPSLHIFEGDMPRLKRELA